MPVVAALFYWSKNVGNVVYSREIAQDAPVIMWCINIQSVYNVHEKSSVFMMLSHGELYRRPCHIHKYNAHNLEFLETSSCTYLYWVQTYNFPKFENRQQTGTPGHSLPDTPTPPSAGTTTVHLASVAMGCLYLPSSFSASFPLSLPFHCTVSLPHRHSHTPLSVSLNRLHQLSHCHLCVAVHARAVWALVLPLALCERPLPM